MAEGTYATILVAFAVHGLNGRDREGNLVKELSSISYGDEGDPIDSWWVAEDSRMDENDVHDSAVFVSRGNQPLAAELIKDHGLIEL